MQVVLDGFNIDVTTIRNGILDGSLRIFNGDKVVFQADLGINHEEIDQLSLDLYKEMLFKNEGLLDVNKVLETMKFITPNFTYSNVKVYTDETIAIGNVKYVFDNEMLTTVNKVTKNNIELQNGTEVYKLNNSDFGNLYVQNNFYDNVLRNDKTDLMSDEINYTYN